MNRDVACRQVVELLTDYLEGALDGGDRVALEQHLLTCAGCTTYLEQLRSSIQVTQNLRPEDVPDQLMDRLLRIFEERSQR